MSKDQIRYTSYREMPPAAYSSGTMLWNCTGSWRFMRPRFVSKVPACNTGCPGGQDVEGWIRLLRKGRFVEAWHKIREENPMPGVTGRVCFHPCEGLCNRKDLDRPVAINNLERFIAEVVGYRVAPRKPEATPTGKRIAVIGAGPAGLSCAFHLNRLGHKTVIYEALPHPGGILRVGIPEYRLPRDVLAKEVATIVREGVEIQTGVALGKDLEFEKVRAEHDAVFIAIGVHQSRALGIPGEELDGVLSGLGFLKGVAFGETVDLGSRVIVVGGGNTAVDCARTAFRLGSHPMIIYRRSREEMPAFEEEISEAEREGITLKLLATPVEVIGEDGRVVAVKCIQMQLGEPDESGRRRPVPVAGSDFVLPVDTIISAIGEQSLMPPLPDEMEIKWGKLMTDQAGMTSIQGVFAGGDIIDQPHTVIDAIASGKRAAIAIDCYLRGRRYADVLERIRLADTAVVSMRRYLELGEEVLGEVHHNKRVTFQHINTDHFGPAPRSKMPLVALSRRLITTPEGHFLEVKKGLSLDSAIKDAERCFACGRCTECDNCHIFCPDVAIRKEQHGYQILMDYCKGCGVCMTECPRSCIEMTEEPVDW